MGREYNIQHWTKMPKEGHFAEMEEPELMVEYIKPFFSGRLAKYTQHMINTD
jgi:hypothetical protein